MFENLKTIGDAFKNFGNSNIDTDEEELVDPLNEKIAERLKERDSELSDLSTKEVMEREKEVFDVKREKKEDSLDKKLANIEKVIGAFSEAPEQAPVPKQDTGSASDNINLKPIDMGSVQAKELINEYLKPSVNSDRVGLLYENLRKLNLI
jgi:spore germination protein GerM|tara:strand:+ start:33 stop:485 length:453 start_codon:yes stop_codon:yes gene_type:complete